MKNQLKKGILYFFLLIIMIPLISSWGGPPPADIVYYGYAYINGSAAPAGTQIEILSNGNTYVMDTDSVIAGGYFPGLQMYWDDPDTTGVDEGVQYSDNAENIYFKIAGITTNYPQFTTVTTSQAGQSILINLSYIYNFQPQIFVDNQTATQDQPLTFGINATDNTSYRTDTLTISGSTLPSGMNINQFNYNSIAYANVTWTPSCSQVCSSPWTPTFTVTDDGIPVQSDSKQISITVANVNDAPSISNGGTAAQMNVAKNINLKTVLSYSDCDSCLGDTSNFTLIAELDPNNGTNFTITDALNGLATFTSDITGTFRYDINVTDAAGLSDSARLTVTVTTTDLVVVKLIEANSDGTYQITDTVYNFNNQSQDYNNLTLTDSELGEICDQCINGTIVNGECTGNGSYCNHTTINRSFSLDYRESITFKANVSIGGSGVVPFEQIVINNHDNGGIYYSNTPSVYIGSCPSGGGGSSGGDSSSSRGPGGMGGGAAKKCPECEECEECPECKPVIQKPKSFMEIIVWDYKMIGALSALALLLLFLLRLLYLWFKVKLNLRYLTTRGKHHHFSYFMHKISFRLDNAKKMHGAIYYKKYKREHLDFIKMKHLFHRIKVSLKGMFKLRQDPFEIDFINARIRKIVKKLRKT